MSTRKPTPFLPPGQRRAAEHDAKVAEAKARELSQQFLETTEALLGVMRQTGTRSLKVGGRRGEIPTLAVERSGRSLKIAGQAARAAAHAWLMAGAAWADAGDDDRAFKAYGQAQRFADTGRRFGVEMIDLPGFRLVTPSDRDSRGGRRGHRRAT